jgi:hypothetical protein
MGVRGSIGYSAEVTRQRIILDLNPERDVPEAIHKEFSHVCKKGVTSGLLF